MNCLHCGKKLRPYRYRFADFASASEMYGGQGDNAFCSKECGYRWATTVLGVYRWKNAQNPYLSIQLSKDQAFRRCVDATLIKKTQLIARKEKERSR